MLTSMNHVSLDIDILFMIISLLSTKDALALSLTSREVHLFAKQHALSSVKLTSPKQLSKFCDSMLAFGVNDEIRIATRGLFSDVPRLAELIMHASHLEFFSIHCVEWLLLHGSPIGDAIASLPNLEELELHQADSQALDMVRMLQSGLRKLVLYHSEYDQFTPPQILPFILPFRNLQVLRLSESCRFEEFDIPWDEQWQWPAVRDLQLIQSQLSMAQFVRAFPCVRKLSLWGVGYNEEPETQCWDSLDYVYIGCGLQSNEFAWSAPCEIPHPAYSGAARLRYLDLTLDLTRRKRGTHLAQWLEKIPPILNKLAIICIRVCIASRNNKPVLSRAAITVRWRLRLATCIHSLRYIAIARKIGGVPCMAEESSWSRVSGPAQERRLQALPTHVGVRVHAYLHAGDMDSLDRKHFPYPRRQYASTRSEM
ncbi:hypothetical protein SCP_1901000 [Sparassis crispa]|uniref:F-box domain-containing protein n=1 Tax=Sparassis crispa TaxID=139825 RepID=A0A401H789_9APHY|nr:hypothetical protein SCP_1901000 [Sparassis crispa]GBE90251.1 hypothetical protein SCP_1901000 [Sparassis crispa]